MTPLSIAYVATAAVCLLVGLQHVVMALRVEDRRLQLLFAIAAFGVAGDAVFERRIYTSATAEEFLAQMPWTALCIATTIVALSWYIAFRTGAVRRELLWTVSCLAVAAVVLDFAVGISYSGPVMLRTSVLPWGEPFVQAVGAANPLRVVGDLALFGFLLVLLDSAVRMARRGEVRQARVLGGSLAVYALGLLTIIPADLGWFRLPNLHTFAFLVIVAAMSWDLSEDLIHASRLSREVIANERRWRQLLDDVHLLAARVDRDGRVVAVNPHFTRVLGYTNEDAAGRESWDFVTVEQRADRRSAHSRAMSGDLTPEVEVTTISKDGRHKHITWRDVVLRDADGEIEGMLSIGADITDQLAAEADRDRALEKLELLKDRLEEENVYLREEIRAEHGFENIVGSSDPLLYVLHKVREVAPSDTSALILGETGVGKELIARTIHAESPRAHGPFVVVNCAALPPNLIESELFGHERGAFTGADRQRRGRFELAHGGTIFLDEVGELPLETQPRLLRVLQEGEIERVGGSQTISVDVRVIAATNRDLNGDMKAGRFREDLFYRVAVYPITVPPLRDRRGDIPPLVQHFAQHYAQQRGKRIDEVPAELMRRLQTYDWPGNVRELQNVIERAVLTSTGDVLKLAEPLQNAAIDTAADAANEFGEGLRTLDQVERRYIERVLASTRGKISGTGGAAEVLGLHANTLRYRMKKLGIPVGRGKNAEPVDR
jgi:PAS domain S-box-containing protein